MELGSYTRQFAVTSNSESISQCVHGVLLAHSSVKRKKRPEGVRILHLNNDND